MIFLWFTTCEPIVEQALIDDIAKIRDGRENTRTRNENRKMTMTFVERRKTRDIGAHAVRIARRLHLLPCD